MEPCVLCVIASPHLGETSILRALVDQPPDDLDVLLLDRESEVGLLAIRLGADEAGCEVTDGVSSLEVGP